MYTLTQFGSLTLPVSAPRHTAGTMRSKQQLVQTISGNLYDPWGSAKVPPELPFELTYDCIFIGSTSTELRTQLDAWREARGTQAALYRRVAGDPTTRQRAQARLEEVRYSTEARHSHGLFQPATLAFTVKTLWRGAVHGARWFLDSGVYLDQDKYLNMHDRYALTTTSTVLTIVNGGNADQDFVRVTLDAGASPVTGLTMQVGACHLVWSGTVAAGGQLVINCAPTQRSVYNSGVAAWNYLDLGGSHASEAWLRFVPGRNVMTVTRTGGGSDTFLTLDFSDLWE